MVRVLHIVDRLSGGGPTRSMIAAVKYLSRLGITHQHRVITLKATAYPIAMFLAKQAGIEVLRRPQKKEILSEIEVADIVHVHFWNSPEIYELFRTPLPAMRLLLWLKILGDHPPQMLSQKLVNYADFILATSPETLKLPILQQRYHLDCTQRVGVVYGIADFDRISNLQPQLHETFNVGYIGTVNFSKMHPDFVSMSVGINIPKLRFVVCGGMEPMLKQQAEQWGAEGRFEFRGYVENIKPVLETLDVFGYPLCKETYATSEKSLQEAMYAGIPPVVFPFGGVKHLVQHDQTGLIVHSKKEYQQAIEYLFYHPDERLRLGKNAQLYAQEQFAGEAAAKRLNSVYEELMQSSKRQRVWGAADNSRKKDAKEAAISLMTEEISSSSPAEKFIESLGEAAPQFRVSLKSSDVQALFEADREIATASILLSSGEGGLFQYRNFYPEDGYLRFWSGLVLLDQGRYCNAMKELQASIELGSSHWRVSWYLAQAATKAENFKLARHTLQKLLQAKPNFAEAEHLLQSLP